MNLNYAYRLFVAALFTVTLIVIAAGSALADGVKGVTGGTGSNGGTSNSSSSQ